MALNISLLKVAAVGLVVCLLALGCAYYLEYEYMLAACPLCMLQRIIFMALAVVFAFGVLIRLSGISVYIYSALATLLTSIGAGLAGRQIWLQYFAPPQTSSCAASLEHLLDLYPVLEVLKMALQGSAECAVIDFTILGLSIAAWSFVLFSALGGSMLYIIFLQKKRRI